MSDIKKFIVGVRFSKIGKVYHFDASNFEDLEIGDAVIVETSRGMQLGWIAQIITNPSVRYDGIKQIARKASPRELVQRQLWESREVIVQETCASRARELRLRNVKVVMAEYNYDGSRLSIFYNTETEEKVELKSLKQDMQRQFSPAQIELKQIGPRDMAKILGGMGACGLENRCCSRFLVEFSSISIRMAKEQNISLTPTEITGMCGRLRCCLFYEYNQYLAARMELPRKKSRVMTPSGEGKVVDIMPMQGLIVVEIPEFGHREFPKDEVQVLEEGK